MKKHFWFVASEVILFIALVYADFYYDLMLKNIFEVNKTVVSLLTITAGFSVTCYLLFIELYKDRYPYFFIDEKIIPQTKENMVDILICISMGIFVLLRKEGMLESIFFFLASSIVIFQIMKSIFLTSRTMMITEHVKAFCAKLSEEIKKQGGVITDKSFLNLKRVMEECVIREEYSVARQISDCSGDVFRDFLKNSISNMDDGKSEQIEKSFVEITKFSVGQLALCDNMDSNILAEEISAQQYKNIEFCVNTRQYEWFKIYCEELTHFCFRAIEKQRNRDVSRTFGILIKSLKLVLKMQYIEWIEYLIQEVSSAMMAATRVNRNLYTREYVRFLTIAILDIEDEKTSKLVFEKLENYTILITGFIDREIESTIEYQMCFDELCEKKKTEVIQKFMKMLFFVEHHNSWLSVWLELKTFCVDRLLELGEDGDAARNYQIKLLMQIIDAKDKYNGPISMPDFKKRIFDVPYSNNAVEKNCKEIETLLNRAIIADNMMFFYFLVRTIEDCLRKATRSQKDISSSLFNIYIWLIERTRMLNNRQFAEVAFESLGDVIEEMDNNNTISDNLGTEIIDRIIEVARRIDTDANFVLIQSIDLLYGFVNDRKKYRFSSSKEKKKAIARGIYNIGVNCIENDFEEGLRSASNALGWFSIHSIKQGVPELVRYIIELAGRMYTFALKMGISPKTTVFLTTLFTTVGTFCRTEPEYHIFEPIVFQNMKGIEREEVVTAIEIRTYENDTFEDLFKNDTERYVKEFLCEFDRSRK